VQRGVFFYLKYRGAIQDHAEVFPLFREGVEGREVIPEKRLLFVEMNRLRSVKLGRGVKEAKGNSAFFFHHTVVHVVRLDKTLHVPMPSHLLKTFDSEPLVNNFLVEDGIDNPITGSSQND
jgi:hypothetical protein